MNWDAWTKFLITSVSVEYVLLLRAKRPFSW